MPTVCGVLVTSPVRLGPEELTPAGIATRLQPFASSALSAATPQIKDRVIAAHGRVAWAVASLGVAAVSRRAVMVVLVRLVVEVLLGVLAPWLAPFLDPLIDAALAQAANAQEPQVRAYLAAVRDLLATPRAALSEPARFGLAFPDPGDQ